MTDNATYQLLKPIIENGMTAQGLTCDLLRSNQPTVSGARSTPSLYLSKINDHLHGTPRRYSQTINDEFKLIDEQTVESTFQITAWVRQTPESVNAPDDYAHMAKSILQTEETINAFVAAGCAVLRITDIRTPYMQDDRDEFQMFPSFDFTLIHKRSIIRSGSPLTRAELQIGRV